MNYSLNNQPEHTPIKVLNPAPKNAVDSYRFSDQRIVQHLETAAANAPTIDQLLANLGQVISSQSECLGLWAIQINENGDFGSAHYLLTDEPNDGGKALWTVVQDHASEMMKRVARTRQICSSPLRSKSETELVAAPVCIGIDSDPIPVSLIIIGCFRAESQSVLRLQWLTGMVSQAIGRWYQHKNLLHQETKARSLNDTIGLVHSLDQTSSLMEASMVVANYIRRVCQVDQVAISFCQNPDNPETAQLTTVSDVEQIDLHCESNKLVAAACNQTLFEQQEIIFPDENAPHTPAMLTLEKYCRANAFESCINLPLKTSDGRTLGSILVAGSHEKISSESFQSYVNQMISMVAGHLDVVKRANRNLRDIAKANWAKIRQANLTKVCLIGFVCCLGLLAIPLPYRVGCDCEIQPVMRRFVASPHDGILEKTFVESGDLVEANQIVAHLDGRQLRIELSALRAEHEGAKKRCDSARAKRDIALSQIAKSEMKRHGARIELIEQQLLNLEVRSIIAGIVVSGDLEKVEGAPLEMGQTLFEIAPLDEMVAEIGIPESEIQYVKPGMSVAIKLNAFPFETWTGTIKQIDPRTEIIQDETVFIAQVRLPNTSNQLRPGMQGSAKIKTKSASLGWNLFHQPWESVRYWLIW